MNQASKNVVSSAEIQYKTRDVMRIYYRYYFTNTEDSSDLDLFNRLFDFSQEVLEGVLWTLND